MSQWTRLGGFSGGRGGLLLITWALSLCLLPGCKGLHQDLCEKAAKCGGGGEDEIDACAVELASDEDIADILGCDSQWEHYVECLDDHAVCEKDKLSGCDDQHDRYKKCLEESRQGKAELDLKSTGSK